MSIIDNVEQHMKRYDHLIEKQTRRYNKGQTLSKEEDEELQKLRPTVLTPLTMMFEILFDTVKTNQEIRRRNRGVVQRGGNVTDTGDVVTTSDKREYSAVGGGTQSTPEAKEAKRLSQLEESLLPLLTKIIVYIEQHKKAAKNKDGEEEVEDEEEKYPDIGTTAKNSVILVIRKIKKWWNDLIQGGASDLSSKINLKKAIPQLPDNPDDLNKMVDKATAAVHEPLQKIEKLLSNDVKDIASSSVEGIMNALSLIPGIGTTLQLWRLLQNVIVIMSKSVTTLAGAKTQGVALKTNIQGVKGEMESMMANPQALAGGLANAAAGGVANAAAGGLANAAGGVANAAAGGLANAAGGLANAAGGLGGLANAAGGLANAAGGLGDMANAAGGLANAAGGLGDMANAAGGLGDMAKSMPGGLGGLANVAGDMVNAAGGISGIANAAGKMVNAAGGIDGIANAAGKMVNAAGGLEGLANVAGVASRGGGLGDMAKSMPGGLGGLANVAGDMFNAAGGISGITNAAGKMVNAAGGISGIANAAGNIVNAAGGIGGLSKGGVGGLANTVATNALKSIPGGKFAAGFLRGGAATKPPHTKQNRLRSIKKYKQEYKQSIRDIRKTKKRIMKYFHNII